MLDAQIEIFGLILFRAKSVVIGEEFWPLSVHWLSHFFWTKFFFQSRILVFYISKQLLLSLMLWKNKIQLLHYSHRKVCLTKIEKGVVIYEKFCHFHLICYDFFIKPTLFTHVSNCFYCPICGKIRYSFCLIAAGRLGLTKLEMHKARISVIYMSSKKCLNWCRVWPLSFHLLSHFLRLKILPKPALPVSVINLGFIGTETPAK